MKLPLPAAALEALKDRSPTRAPPLSDEALADLLAEHGYAAHPAVLAFEAAFGGLEFSEDGDDDLRFLVGAGACVGSGAHAGPRGGPENTGRALVPVIYTPNDGIGYLDADGAGWFHDTIEHASASRVAADGAALLAGFLVNEA
jgi:hypothetical protein